MLILLFQLACTQNTQKGQNSTTDENTRILKEQYEEIQIAPPTNTKKPPLPPPPPPPVIEEVPEEEIEEEIILEAPAAMVEASPPPPPAPAMKQAFIMRTPGYNTESYDHFTENEFHDPLNNPLSTFSVDVDYASYSNVRRMLNNGRIPPKGAIRLEEMINYFDYNYSQPQEEVPLSIYSEVAACPWNKDHQLVHIGLQARQVVKEQLPPGNLVFLLDVSGSMNSPKKLPLLKNAFRMLINQLRPNDRVAIVVYAGSSGLVLPSTPGNQKQKIRAAINQLNAGGSTAGAAGIQLAYQEAKKHFVEGGNNRVILATDGDFNVGLSSQSKLVELIEEERKSGIFLSVLGFGTGNYKDSKMEQLADNGNGNYAYIDQLSEARKVLVNEFSSTLFTVAKDVKLQVEFNPAKVKAYRLVGYENRVLANKDFNDDLKDAGDMGAGHTVTALYEVIPKGSPETLTGAIDPLKYQQPAQAKPLTQGNSELMTVKFRYKEPQGEQSKLLSIVVTDKGLSPSENFRFSAAVASFGLLLRDSKFKGDTNYASIRKLAEGAIGKDPFGYRRGFLDMIDLAELLDEQVASH